MNVYYQNNLPVIQNGRPMLTPLPLSFSGIEQAVRLQLRYGYSIFEISHETKEQKAMEEKEVSIGDFRHELWKIALDAGASNKAAIVVSLGCETRVIKGIAVSSEEVRNEVINHIFNRENPTFAEVRKYIGSYCYKVYCLFSTFESDIGCEKMTNESQHSLAKVIAHESKIIIHAFSKVSLGPKNSKKGAQSTCKYDSTEQTTVAKSKLNI